MKILTGLVENSVIRVKEGVALKENEEVIIVAEEGAVIQPELKGFKADEIKPLIGAVSLGGNALEDTEKLWDEKNHNQ